MNAIERLNFVIWAKTRLPGFTTDAEQYARATRAWKKYRREDPLVDKVIRPCYN